MITVTVETEAMAKAIYKKLGHNLYMDLLEEHDGCPERFAAKAFPSIISFHHNPDPKNPDYVGSYTFGFASESDAVFFRMTA